MKGGWVADRWRSANDDHPRSLAPQRPPIGRLSGSDTAGPSNTHGVETVERVFSAGMLQVHMTPPARDLGIYECSTCGDLRLSDVDASCCDGPMDPVETAVPTESPDVEELMRDVFDISPTELEVCRQVMGAGETTIGELVESIDRDRSVVSRHLNHLVELGVVAKRSRVLAEGGRIGVYSPRSEDVVRRQLKLGLYAWCLDAIDLLEDVNEEKIAMMAESAGSDGSTAARSVVDRLLARSDSP